MNNQQQQTGQGNQNPHPQTGPEVAISINTQPIQIHRGNRPVVEIKDAGHVPRADELEQIVNGKLVPLADDGSVVIKGGEQFVSHPRSGGSS
jgi:hypothetical protein